MPRLSLVCSLSLIVMILAGCTPASTPAPTASSAPSAVTAAVDLSATPAASTPAAGPRPIIGPTANVTVIPAAAAQPTAGAAPAAGSAGSTPARPSAQPSAQATPTQDSSQAPASVETAAGLQLVAEGLTAPVALVPAPDGSGRLFVVDQAGLIRIIGSDGKLLPDPFLDLRDRMVQLSNNYDERGLLGLAFHPDFAHNQRLFVYYTAPLRAGAPARFDNTEHLSEFKIATGDPNHADVNSERVLLAVDHPQANHDGGTVVFGPDSYLYLSIGDGGGANDTDNGHTPGLGNGQDMTKLLGKILRIDVNSGNPYGIPKDNPFAAGGGAPEIYAYGLRNPYRFSFDMAGSHQLFAADVGQNLFEEVDIIARGGNYGWNIKEGFHCFSAASPSQPSTSCAQTGARGEPLIDPILEYSHPDPGIAIVGGYVYRGQALPGLSGRYIFGDWSTSFGMPDGTLLVAQQPASGQGAWSFQKLPMAGNSAGHLGHFLLGLGQDSAGEIYVLTSDKAGPASSTGRVFKLVSGQQYVN